MDLAKIGQNIKTERLKKNLTQSVLAEKANISSVHLSHIESGNVSMSIESMLNICNALEITPNEILLGQYGVANEKVLTQLGEFTRNLNQNEFELIVEITKVIEKLRYSKA